MFESLPTNDFVAKRIDALDIPFNHYGIDPYGVDKETLKRFCTLAYHVYTKYFTVEAYGFENIPRKGRAMLIGNHSGGVAIDAAMIMAALLFEADPPIFVHAMVERFIHRFPGAAQLMSRTGQFTGNPDQALRLLEDNRRLLIFPEGAKGTAKLAKDADSLVRFGTGFMRLALQSSSPIIPVGFVGGGEAMPTIANLYTIGRWMGVPYLPVTKYLLPIPKPTTFQILYGKPMIFHGSGDERDDVINGLVDEVKLRIASLIEQGRALRSGKLSADELKF